MATTRFVNYGADDDSDSSFLELLRGCRETEAWESPASSSFFADAETAALESSASSSFFAGAATVTR